MLRSRNCATALLPGHALIVTICCAPNLATRAVPARTYRLVVEYVRPIVSPRRFERRPHSVEELQHVGDVDVRGTAISKTEPNSFLSCFSRSLDCFRGHPRGAQRRGCSWRRTFQRRSRSGAPWTGRARQRRASSCTGALLNPKCRDGAESGQVSKLGPNALRPVSTADGRTTLGTQVMFGLSHKGRNPAFDYGSRWVCGRPGFPR